MTQHTPGPWHPGHLGQVGRCQCRSVCSEGYAGGIATVHVSNGIASLADGGNDAPPEREAVANMHMIAAAPDMHAALTSIIDAWNRGDTHDGHEALGMAEAALAKASGATEQK